LDKFLNKSIEIIQSTKSDSRTPLKDKLNKQVILFRPTNGTIKSYVLYRISQVYPDILTINDNYFDKTKPLIQLSFVSLLSGLS